MRTVTDVAALAWNIPIFDSSLPKSFGGPWLSVGGTSASAPLIAGVYALAGNAATIAPGYTYHHASHLFDVTTGNNALFASPAQTCGNDYLCAAKPGYDAPTGLGTPTAPAPSDQPAVGWPSVGQRELQSGVPAITLAASASS
jgi:subtilase family serine protease